MYNDQQPNPGSWQEEEQRMTLPPKRGNGFSTASMTAGTLSLFFLVSGLSFPVGALGILFALLSRKGDKMDPQAKLGCILSIIGLCLGICHLYLRRSHRLSEFPGTHSAVSAAL